MSDMELLIFGVVVFGLMLTGAVMTIMEFSQLSDREAANVDSKSDAPMPLMSQDRD